jgi:transketolase
MDADVAIVSVGGGLSYGVLGASHHATEDIAVMRAMPNMKVIAPNDAIETKLAVRGIIKSGGPAYLRLDRGSEINVHPSENIDFELGKSIRLKPGKDVAIIATGGLLGMAMNSAQILEESLDISCAVISMHTIKPIDSEAINKLCKEVPLIVTLEEHSLVGGLGSAVAEVIVDSGIQGAVLKRIALPSNFIRTVGSQSYLREINGITDKSVVEQIRSYVNSK